MKHYASIQWLRALAALMVVALHATNVVRDRMDADAWQFMAGGAGVDIFFVISGFIMVATTRDMWARDDYARQFFYRRLVRIVPLYWIATSLKLAMMLAVPAMLAHATLDPWHVVSSYLFIPAWNAEHKPYPILVPGWSLVYEMVFYIWFAVALWLRANPVYVLTPLFLAAVAYWCVYAPFDAAPMVLLEPRLLEFCAGMWIAQLVHAKRIIPYSAAVMLLVLVGAIFAYSAIYGELDIPYFWGVPAALLVYAAVSLDGRVTLWQQRVMHHLGDASYSIYLFHPFAITAVGMVIGKLGLSIPASLVGALVLGTVASVISGVLVHRLIERPLLVWLRR